MKLSEQLLKELHGGPWPSGFRAAPTIKCPQDNSLAAIVQRNEEKRVEEKMRRMQQAKKP